MLKCGILLLKKTGTQAQPLVYRTYKLERPLPQRKTVYWDFSGKAFHLSLCPEDAGFQGSINENNLFWINVHLIPAFGLRYIKTDFL